jgi:hypothetical protein
LARADDVTLNVSGSLAVANPPGTCSVAGCTLGGDIVINNATGTVISQDVTMSGESPSVGPFTTFVNLQSIVGETRLALVDSSANWIEFFFATPTPGSLVGYDGGALDTITGVGFPPPTAPTWLWGVHPRDDARVELRRPPARRIRVRVCDAEMYSSPSWPLRGSAHCRLA